MVKQLTGILFFCILLSGCHTLGNSEPAVRTVVVKVPVAQCPDNHNKIQKPLRPKLAIENLVDEDIEDPGKVVKAYKITVKQLQGYSQELENGFDAYRLVCTKESIESDSTENNTQ